MNRRASLLRWLMVGSVAGLLPSLFLRCDKATLNFERALLQALGEDAADLLIEQVLMEAEDEDGGE